MICLQNLHFLYYVLFTDNDCTGVYVPWRLEGFSYQEKTNVYKFKTEQILNCYDFHYRITLVVLGSLYPHQCHRCAWSSVVKWPQAWSTWQGRLLCTEIWLLGIF